MLRLFHIRVESLTCTSDNYTPFIIDSSDNTAYACGCSIILDSNIAFGHLSDVDTTQHDETSAQSSSL